MVFGDGFLAVKRKFFAKGWELHLLSIKISIPNTIRNDAGLVVVVVVAGSPLRSMLSLLTWVVGLGLQGEPWSLMLKGP